MEISIKFFALYFHILEAMEKGLTLAQASLTYTGEELQAAQYFHNYLNSRAHA